MFSSQLFGASSGGQTFSMGGASQGAGQDGRKPRQEEHQSCLPVTVRAIEDALALTGGGGELQFYGAEPGMLIAVGCVESASREGASFEFTLNDGTGRVKVRHFVAEDTPGALEGIASGSFVSLFGNVRTSPVPHLAATGLRRVLSADEISYHMIEVAHAHLKLQKGKAPQPATPEKRLAAETLPRLGDAVAEPISPPKDVAMPSAAAPVLSAAVKTAVALEGVALQGAILAFLRKEGEGNAGGVAFEAVCSNLAPSKAEVVRDALNNLVGEGEAFNTIDDNHFLLV